MIRCLLVVCVLLAVALAKNTTVGSDCTVGCTYPPHYWLSHKSHPAWETLVDVSLCGGTAHDALSNTAPAEEDDAGHEAASQIVAARLSMAAALCFTGAPKSLAVVSANIESGCVGAELDEQALGELTDWTAGRSEDGPCHCTDLECARYVAPQEVIDEQTAKIEKLSGTEVGFLVWAIVVTVVAAILAVVVVVLLLRMDWDSWRGWLPMESDYSDAPMMSTKTRAGDVSL